MFKYSTARLRILLWLITPRSIQNAWNVKKLDKHVIPWERLVRRASKRKQDRKPAFVYTHIPKTGGTTLEDIVSKNYSIKGAVHINSLGFHLYPGELFRNGAFPKAVMGHHKLNQVLYQFIDKPIAHVTMLREPVSRVISYYNYLLTSPDNNLHKQVSKMSFEEFVESSIAPELDNGQVMRLAGLLKRKQSGKVPDPEQAFDAAQRNLIYRFSFFGLTERYIEFLLTARQLLGWKDIFHDSRNVSPKKISKADVSDSLIDKIKSRNELDIRLYEFAVELFNERCENLGIDKNAVNNFKEANQKYCELLNTKSDRPSVSVEVSSEVIPGVSHTYKADA